MSFLAGSTRFEVDWRCVIRYRWCLEVVEVRDEYWSSSEGGRVEAGKGK